MIVNSAVITKILICQTLRPKAANKGDAAGLTLSAAIVGARVTSASNTPTKPAGMTRMIRRRTMRSDRQRVSRQLVTKARQTPADVVPSSGRVKINRRFR